MMSMADPTFHLKGAASSSSGEARFQVVTPLVESSAKASLHLWRIREDTFSDNDKLSIYARGVVSAMQSGRKTIIVHDGGCLVADALRAAGIDPVSDAATNAMNPKAMHFITETIESVNDKIAKAIRNKLSESGLSGKVIQAGITTGSSFVYGTPTGAYIDGCNGIGGSIDSRVLIHELSKADVIVVSSLARYDGTNDFGFVNIDAGAITGALANALGAKYDILQ